MRLTSVASVTTQPPTDEIRRIYAESRVIAVVGASPDPSKRAHVVPSYLQDVGYRIVPVNPHREEVLGEPSYPTLIDIPEPVDVVEVFFDRETRLPRSRSKRQPSAPTYSGCSSGSFPRRRPGSPRMPG